MARLRLYVDGEPGKITFDSFIAVMDNALAILRDLDSAISSDPTGTLQWLVTELSLASASVGIESKTRKPPADYGPAVAERFVEGLQQIEHEGTTPPYFSDYDLRKTQQLARLLRRDGVSRFTATNVDVGRSAAISARTGVNATELLAPRYQSIGSVTGRLEMISVHRQPRFSIYDALTHRAVSCRFRPEEMLQQVKDGLGRRVVASGIVRYNHKGEPIRVELKSLEILPLEEELPSLEQLKGMAPDFTGDLRTEEFLRRVRDA